MKVERKKTGKTISEKFLDRLLTCFSHEFRTPLNSIITFSDLLMFAGDEPFSAETKESLEAIHKGGLRLLRLIEKLTLMTELEQNTAIFNFKSVFLNDAVHSAVQAVAGQYPLTKLEVDIPENINVFGDEVKLHNLFVEIIENSVVHGNPEHPVEIKCRLKSRKAEISVTSTMKEGQKADPAKVFRKFVQGNEGDLTAKPPGLGLGLSIAKKIAQRHKGSISASLLPGKRWKTLVLLPLSPKGKNG